MILYPIHSNGEYVFFEEEKIWFFLQKKMLISSPSNKIVVEILGNILEMIKGTTNSGKKLDWWIHHHECLSRGGSMLTHTGIKIEFYIDERSPSLYY